ncbi:MAG: GNAT family N-acetyltransferase [Flavobacteriaceae bacterium]|nr:GNAT family N-acetyltransferase [Flavobacteriaceae bacterium]
MVKNSILYKTIEGIPDTEIYQDIVNLYSEIFEDADLKFFKKRVEKHAKLFSVLAYHDNKLIGLKIGYPYREDTFYSWIGGVHAEFRRQGVAINLAINQEEYAKTKGFTRLRTKSMNQYKPMMILNLKNGFDIINIYTNTKGQTKIVFEKLI